MIRGAFALVLSSVMPLAAQSPIYPSATGAVGVELRTNSFGEGIRLSRASQVAFPMIAGVPLGRRLFVDVTTSYAITDLESVDGIKAHLEGFTDTRVRAAYTVGRDAGVFSLEINLPTGEEKVSSLELTLLRSIAQNFLPFPVTNYGMGAGLTGAFAAARRMGPWTIGAAAALRYVSGYSPFVDVNARYTPGVEGRVRIGVRRLLGQNTSMSAGFTFSTVGDDQFAGVQSFTYNPGNRYIGELALAHNVGRSTVRLFTWGYWRSQGDSSGITVERAQERVLYGGAVWSVPVSSRITLHPGIDARGWQTADDASGWFGALSLGGRMRLSTRLTVAPTVRFERGRITVAQGVSSTLTGLAGSVYLRVVR